MNTIARLALLALRGVEPSSELSSDIVLFLMVCVIGWVKTNRIMDTTDFPEYKEDDLANLIEELNHISISSLVDEFLKENDNEDNEQFEV